MPQTIGIKALRDALSAVIRSLEPGETVEITDRGRVVAHLVAPAQPSDSSYDRLAESGALRLPRRQATPFAAWPPPGWQPLPSGTVQELLAQERAERDG